ncbi:MAG: carbohydrate-binding domain-containing protein [Gemmatales bacterium]
MSILFVFATLIAMPTVDDAIKLDIKAGKFKAEFEGTKDLIGYNDNDEKAFFYVNGSVELAAKVPSAGEYTITINASCQAALKENAKINISVDGKEIAKDFTLTTEDPKDYTFTAKFKEGEGKVTITYTNDVYKENEYDRNFYLHAVTLKKK